MNVVSTEMPYVSVAATWPMSDLDRAVMEMRWDMSTYLTDADLEVDDDDPGCAK